VRQSLPADRTGFVEERRHIAGGLRRIDEFVCQAPRRANQRRVLRAVHIDALL
jgi:hypothetical protein